MKPSLSSLIEKQKAAYQERFKHSQFIEHASIITFLEASAREIAETLYREIRPEDISIAETPTDQPGVYRGGYYHARHIMEEKFKSYCEKV